MKSHLLLKPITVPLMQQLIGKNYKELTRVPAWGQGFTNPWAEGGEKFCIRSIKFRPLQFAALADLIQAKARYNKFRFVQRDDGFWVLVTTDPFSTHERHLLQPVETIRNKLYIELMLPPSPERQQEFYLDRFASRVCVKPEKTKAV